MNRRATYRLGVDVGGTFADLVLYDLGTDRLEFAKTPSRPGDEATGVAESIRDLVERLRIPPGEIDFFVHGSTIATNASFQLRGARTLPLS